MTILSSVSHAKSHNYDMLFAFIDLTSLDVGSHFLWLDFASMFSAILVYCTSTILTYTNGSVIFAAASSIGMS